MYQLLLNTSNTGGQFRFTRDGNILYRTYNTENNAWSDWAVAFKNIPNGVITEAMLDSNFLLSYDNIEDEYIRIIRIRLQQCNGLVGAAGQFLGDDVPGLAQARSVSRHAYCLLF